MKWLYLIAAILGTVLPLSYAVSFVIAHGPDFSLFLKQLLQNNASAMFGADVLISAIALWMFVLSEGRRREMKNLWAYVVCTSLVGVSLGLPLFLYMRTEIDIATVTSEMRKRRLPPKPAFSFPFSRSTLKECYELRIRYSSASGRCLQ